MRRIGNIVGLTPSYPNIERYYEDKQRLIDFGGSNNELSTRSAFQNCLTAYCAAHRDKLVPELASSNGTRPDGAVRTRCVWRADARGSRGSQQWWTAIKAEWRHRVDDMHLMINDN